jgi:hypothetical protein
MRRRTVVLEDRFQPCGEGAKPSLLRNLQSEHRWEVPGICGNQWLDRSLQRELADRRGI